MAMKVYKFGSLDELNHFLNGGVIGGTELANTLVPIVGKTVVFTNPAGSHTFVAGANPAGLSLPEVKTQLEAAVTGLRVVYFERHLAFIEASPATGIVVASGTALLDLGFDPNGVTGLVYAGPFSGAPPTPPYFVSAYASGENAHVVYVEE